MSVFEVLDRDKNEEAQADRRTVIAAQERARAQFKNFVDNGRDSADAFDARLALVDDEVRRVAEEVAAEHGGGADRAYLAATAALGAAHQDGCGCGFCENKGSFGEDPEEEIEADEKTASAKKTACACGCSHEGCNCGDDCDGNCHGEKKASRASDSSWVVIGVELSEAETGDNYQQERVDLPSADESGLGGPSPKIDKGKSGDHEGWDLDPIDVGSEKHRLEKQDIAGGWEWSQEGEDGPISIANADLNDPDFTKDLDSPVHEDADVTEAVGPPDTDRTKTWTGTEGLADPVTARYHIVAAE